MGNDCKCCKENENQYEINVPDYYSSNDYIDITNSSKKKSETIIELFISDGVSNFNWEFHNYQYISEIVDRIKKETNIRNEIQLLANSEVLSMNEKIGNKLHDKDLVIYIEVKKYRFNSSNDYTNITNPLKKKSETIIELFISNGVSNFNWEFHNYQYISEIADRIKKETNIRNTIQLIANTEVLLMNEKIGNKLHDKDLVIYHEFFPGGKYFN